MYVGHLKHSGVILSEAKDLSSEDSHRSEEKLIEGEYE